MGFLGGAYLWVKAAHVIFVIFWMAGLFMLPRYLVYHQEADPESPENAIWVSREHKLISIILNPAMIAVWACGLALLVSSGAAFQQWFQLKFLFVIGLSGYHGWLVGYHRTLARGQRLLSGNALRLLNEVPGITVVVIVFLVIIKPF
ncbi:CopD family protein [Sphingomonas sp.]|uniref:CopD family protein n=1 Tax=Sphingomonas sp. TaxID=28214 RepID=UPI0025DF4DD0|nr:CopD family protein [Sphingomonas sp.]